MKIEFASVSHDNFRRNSAQIGAQSMPVKFAQATKAKTSFLLCFVSFPEQQKLKLRLAGNAYFEGILY